jgi:hypothetical protein
MNVEADTTTLAPGTEGPGTVPQARAGIGPALSAGSGVRVLMLMVVIGAITLLFAGAAMVISFREGTWHDEAWSMTTARYSLWETIQRAFQAEGQPPLYFVLLNGWLRLHRSIGFARLFSLLATVAGGLLFVRTVRIAQPRAPRWVTVLAALYVFSAPFAMNLAIEARGYGLQMLAGTALVWIAARALARGKATVAETWALMGLGVAAAYIHYAAILAPAVVVLMLLLFGVFSWRKVALMVAGMAAFAAPLVYGMTTSIRLHAGGDSATSARAGLAVLIRNLSATLLPAPSVHDTRQALAYFLVVAIVGTALVVRWRRRERAPRALLAFGLASGTALVLLALAAMVLGEAAVVARYMACTLPVLWIASMLLMGHSLGWKAATVLLIPFFVLGTYRSWAMHSSGIRKGDWRRTAEKIVAEADGPKTVLIFPPVETLAARVELGDHYRVFGFPHDFDGKVAAEAETYFMPEAGVLRRKLVDWTGSQPFWLAYETPVFGGPNVQHTLAPLQVFLNQFCKPIRKSSFERPRNGPKGKTHLDLYQLLPDTEDRRAVDLAGHGQEARR